MALLKSSDSQRQVAQRRALLDISIPLRTMQSWRQLATEPVRNSNARPANMPIVSRSPPIPTRQRAGVYAYAFGRVLLGQPHGGSALHQPIGPTIRWRQRIVR